MCASLSYAVLSLIITKHYVSKYFHLEIRCVGRDKLLMTMSKVIFSFFLLTELKASCFTFSGKWMLFMPLLGKEKWIICSSVLKVAFQ
jgi:hypothetical protein